MDPRRANKPGPPEGENTKLGDLELKIVAQAFLELFELLQEYAPIWYTEQHHDRALAAYRILRKSRGAAS